MDVLSSQQLQEISDIISDHVGVIMHFATGEGKPSHNLLRQLGLPVNASSMIDNAYVLGKLVQILQENDIKNLTYDELKEKVKELSLSRVEQNSLQYAKNNAARYVTALGQKVQGNILARINQTSQQLNLESVQRNLIKDTVVEGILKQQTRGKLASELGHNLEDWKRDWQRVAHTELWNAKLQGEVVTILQGQSIYNHSSGGDSIVFRRPAPDACVHCKRLYLEDGTTIPKLFKLSELISNGTNVGKKVGDWLPITGTTHPNCTCPIAVLPDGFGFDAEGELEFKS